MSANPALDALLAAHATNGDARLLAPALDVAASDADRRRVVNAAAGAEDLDLPLRERLARTSLDMGDSKLAAELCSERPELLGLQVEAMIAAGRLAEAESYYLASVAENPVRESADITAMIDDAKTETPDLGANVIGFASAARGVRSDARRRDDETAAARTMFAESAQPLRFSDVGGLDDVK